MICSSDAIVFRVLAQLDLAEQGISLEEILQRIGFGRDVALQFRKAFRLEHLTVKCSVSAASKVGAAFVCVHRAEYFADGLDQPFNGSRGDSA